MTHPAAPGTARALRLPLIAALCLLLAACGFHLKGASPVPFERLYTNIDLNTEFGARLQRTIAANSPDTRFVSELRQADGYLHQLSEQENLRQVSLDAEGRIEEYELELIFSFELLGGDDETLLPPTTLRSVRELPYNDRIVQAKESEITRTFTLMRSGLIDQILRRMSSPEVAEAAARARAASPADPQLGAGPRPGVSTAPPVELRSSPLNRPVNPVLSP